jgi:NAD+ kinase
LNILVIYKKSLHQIYFNEHRQQLIDAHNVFSEVDRARLLASHESHVGTRANIEAALQSRGVRYKAFYRARQVDYTPYDFVISVGGDGTFLEAARQITTQPILGVNSDPERSVGAFCPVTRDSFDAALDQVLSGACETVPLNRMFLIRDDKPLRFLALNDVLISHASPAAMSKYRLTVGDATEDHNGSGLWICAAAGSTGGIRSAGGKVMARRSKRLQYKPRELYSAVDDQYQLCGGIIPAACPLIIESRMREGCAYIDGAHMRIPLPFASRLEIRNADYPLRMMVN